MKHTNKELLSLILMISSGALILGLAVALVYGIVWLLGVEHGLWYLLGYLVLSIGAYVISKRRPHKASSFLSRFLSMPFRFIAGLLPVAMPYFVLQIHLLIYLFVSVAIPLCFYVLDRATGWLDLKITTHIYIIVTFGVITATLMNKPVKYLTYLFSPVRLYRTNAEKRTDFNKLTDYFLSENNIKFIIYFCYFLYLLIFNLFTFQEHSFYSSPMMDRAVLQSFITFIALERLLSNLKDLDFKPSEMLKLLLTSISGKQTNDAPKDNQLNEKN